MWTITVSLPDSCILTGNTGRKTMRFRVMAARRYGLPAAVVLAFFANVGLWHF